tara:strand:+ start:548 stop:985 length:438 start_codon:yes stop_codon:yes gene_type:complete
MKIYIENLEINDINHILTNNKLYITNSSKNDIYSNEGIFTIIKNNIHKLNIIQNDTFTIKDYLNKYTIHIDYSSIKPLKYNVFHIPIPNFSHKYTEHLIQLNEHSPLTLVILTSQKIDDWYFITNETIDNTFVKYDINKLISYIK